MKDIILSIDPASYKAGVALFIDGQIHTQYLVGRGVWAERLQQQAWILDDFLNKHLNGRTIKYLVVEEVAQFGNSKLAYSVGALCVNPFIKSELYTIGTSTWKSMVRRCGYTGKNPKGLQALLTVRPDWTAVHISDDEADAVLIGLSFLEKGVIDD